MPRRLALAWGLAALVVSAGSVRAEQPTDDKERAAALAAEAEELGRDKRYDAALQRYKEAARLDPSAAAYLCNIGMAYYALANYPRAHLYLSRCHRAHGSWPDNVLEVFRYVESVLQQQDYTPVTIQGTPVGAEVEVSFYRDEGSSAAPITVYLPFARYEVQVRAEGHVPTTLEINAVNRNPQAHSFSLAPVSVAAGNAVEADPTAGGGEDTAPGGGTWAGDVSAGPRDGGGPSLVPWIVIGSGAAAAVVGGGFFLSALSIHSDLEEPLPDEGDRPALEERMQDRQNVARILAGVGAVTVGVGVFLLVRDKRERRTSGVTVSGGPTGEGGMVFLGWSH